ncbi:MAG: SDR family oxidoreductase [Alphaproteobacteria bacterium]|nr:SDR family oxidoreductase [Alphaproteobacteria bacterium]
MTDLNGKTAIVTGAGRGLGRAMAKGLFRAGAAVTLVELDADVLDEAVAEIGDGCIGVAADVSKPEDAQRIMDRTLAAFGGLHILVNNAGLGPERFRDTDRSNAKMIWEIDFSDWQLFLDVNTTGHFVMTKAVMPHLLAQDWGRIVNVTTSLDTMTNYTNGAYGPSKAALEAHTAIMARDLDGTGVTANALIPGGPANTRMIPDATGIPRDTLIQPEDMQAPAVWLASNDSDGHNGERFIAGHWNEGLEKASAPCAWPQLGKQAILPKSIER